MIQAKLKIEIMAGYLVLVSCFVFIICLVHEERGKKSAMERQELYWQGEYRGSMPLIARNARKRISPLYTEQNYFPTNTK